MKFATAFGLLALCMPVLLPAQHMHDASMAVADSATPLGVFNWNGIAGRAGLMGIGVVSRVSPAINNNTFTEGYLTQPNAMIDAQWRHLAFNGTANFEGYTLRRGELTPGIYGEGYVDRRHPHTLLHEAMLSIATGTSTRDGFVASLSVGKGFAPYGTDDPMMRPMVKYPVNHHHAQILERAQVTGALRYAIGARDITIEAGVFNGDEPTGPFAQPRISRVGDSRAARLTIRPLSGLELQSSAAHVASPDIIQGGAADHEQLSASARWQGRVSNSVSGYAFAEFARTDETHDGHRDFRYESLLAEAMASWRGMSAAARLERTDRPEKDRLVDQFRTPIGHIDFSILGITRWRTVTVQFSAPALMPWKRSGSPALIPFVEVARAVPAAVITPTVFEPTTFYGASTIWSYSAGLRLHLGTMRSRMGRYGVALPRSTGGMSATEGHHH